MRQYRFTSAARIACATFLVTALTASALAAEKVKAPAAAATDWPMWGGSPSRNLIAPGATPPTTWDVEAGTNIRWAAELGGAAYGNPVLADGRLFVGTNNEHPRNPAIKGDRGVLMCFAAADGKFLWQDVYEKLAAGDSQDWQLIGIGSSPAVAGERVYYVNNRGQIVCADVEGFGDGENDGPITNESPAGPHDADIVWRFDMLAELGVIPRYLATSNPLVVDGRLYVITSNGVDADSGELKTPDAPSFVALDAATGKLLWQEGSVSGPQHKVHVSAILDGQWGSPCWVPASAGRAAQVCFPGGDGWLYALDPATGALVWKFDCNLPGSVWKPGGPRRSQLSALHAGRRRRNCLRRDRGRSAAWQRGRATRGGRCEWLGRCHRDTRALAIRGQAVRPFDLVGRRVRWHRLRRRAGWLSARH
jgi:outer membrane protein assembly factor BamB